MVATYVISTGVRELVTYGRSPGMSLWDEPVGDGPRYLVERRIDRAVLPWVVADYVNQSRRRGEPAMVMPPWDSGEQEIEPLRSSWNAPVTFVAA